MGIEDIRKSRGLDSLEYATVGMLERAIGLPAEDLCLSCWED
jgi:glutamine phosphoribosylpyrophosphate amidotransferase